MSFKRPVRAQHDVLPPHVDNLCARKQVDVVSEAYAALSMGLSVRLKKTPSDWQRTGTYVDPASFVTRARDSHPPL